MKNRMNVMSAVLLVAIILLATSFLTEEKKAEELDACHMYKAYENVKTAFGGYVPEWCMSDKEFVDSVNQ